MASFPMLFARDSSRPAPARRRGNSARRGLARSLATFVGFLGLQAGSIWTLAQPTMAQDFSPSSAGDIDYSLTGSAQGARLGSNESPSAMRSSRRQPRGVMPFRWPSKDAAPAREREAIAPAAFESFIGDDSDDAAIPSVVAQPDDPPVVPPRRNPLFRDPDDNETIPPGVNPNAVPGSGPDDLYVAEDDSPFVLDPEDDQPLGLVGRRMYRPPMMQGMDDFYPIDDRWRLGFPQWNRYLQSRWANPWSASVLKGDYPIWGTADKFTQLTVFSDTFYETKTVPFAGGKVDLHAFQETVFVTQDFFRGDNSFHPSEWFCSITPAFRHVSNNGGSIDDFTIQQGFIDYQIAVTSNLYDTTNLRAGRQAFASDFRNFLFADTNDAVRLFGTGEGLRNFWNVIGFNMVQKDASGLNTFDNREQQVLIGNFIRQDFMFSGLNALAGVNWNHDRFNRSIDAVYLEAAVNGRIGQFGVSGAFIQALGHDEFNPIAGQAVNVNAQLAALEITRPTDWFTPRISGMYASGDNNPTDGVGTGFDMIFDNPNFAGGGFSYLNRQAIQIGGTRLSNGFSFLPNLRNKNVDPSNFVNPGLFMINAGVDAVLTTRWQMQLNANYYEFANTAAVNAQSGQVVGRDLGKEVSLGLLYRPLLVENVILTFGAAAFDPGSGITVLSGNDDTLYHFFTALTAVY